MSNDDFEITPGCYDRQLDATYRYSTETVTFHMLEEARAKCMKWIAANKDHFSLWNIKDLLNFGEIALILP